MQLLLPGNPRINESGLGDLISQCYSAPGAGVTHTAVGSHFVAGSACFISVFKTFSGSGFGPEMLLYNGSHTTVGNRESVLYGLLFVYKSLAHGIMENNSLNYFGNYFLNYSRDTLQISLEATNGIE